MQYKKLEEFLVKKPLEISLEHLFENLKANSGGNRDLNFLNFLLDANLLSVSQASLKRTTVDLPMEYYLENYKKMQFESDRHFYCRASILEELKRLEIPAESCLNVGNMEILKENSVYDVVTLDLNSLIDIGLTPARNFFRGLTDLRTKGFLVTSLFDDYMDDIEFAVFKRMDDQAFLSAVRDYYETGSNTLDVESKKLELDAESDHFLNQK